MEGVIADDVEKDIQITAGDDPGTQKVVFKSTSTDLTKEKAVEAIGDKYKDRYVVKTLKKEEAKG